MTDLGDTIAPNSDQLDAVDLLPGPQTFTIQRVTKNAGEQPISIHLAEFPRPWRPGKSMRRVLVAVWGADGAQYVGRRLTLWCDPTVRFGGAEVGGVRITHMSHLDKPKSIPLLVTRGKSAPYKVEPLKDEPAPKPAADHLKRLGALINKRGLQKDEALAQFGKLIGREITSTRELTSDEAEKIIAALEAQKEADQ